MSLRTFWRWAAKPETLKILRGLVNPVDETPRWTRGLDGRQHQSAHFYRVAMSLLLTPCDERSLSAWLYRQFAEGNPPLVVIQTALETPVSELIPWPDQVAAEDEFAGELHSVQEVLQAGCGPIADNQQGVFGELADKLAHRLTPPKDLIFLTRYFVAHWLPRSGLG